MKPRRWISIVFSLLLIPLPSAGQQHSAIPADAANPHATPEVRALVKYLYSISGHYTLSGQHNYPNHIARWTDRVYDLTGKYPALFGEDFEASCEKQGL